MHTKFERRCVACRQNKLQSDMIRVARIKNEFMLDINHKLDGRGAYICNSKPCIEQTIKKHLLNRAYKTNVGDEIYKQLGEYEQNC